MNLTARLLMFGITYPRVGFALAFARNAKVTLNAVTAQRTLQGKGLAFVHQKTLFAYQFRSFSRCAPLHELCSSSRMTIWSGY
jgi:hypothetical protein